MRIRQAENADLTQLLAIINEAAQAYRGVIPGDRWRDPYMPEQELLHEIGNGVSFWVAEEDNRLLAVLIGTWADASWAIDFYRRNGFTLVPPPQKDRLLRTYWSIPERQIETSVVLADERWSASQ